MFWLWRSFIACPLLAGLYTPCPANEPVRRRSETPRQAPQGRAPALAALLRLQARANLHPLAARLMADNLHTLAAPGLDPRAALLDH